MNSWSSQSAPTVLKGLNSSTQGLTSMEAKNRLLKEGFNEIRSIGGVHWTKIMIRQWINIMTIILLAAMAVSFAVSELIEGVAILIIVLLNVLIGFAQEYKAEKAIEALREMTAPFAVVIRDGHLVRLPAKELVPGDIVQVEEGMRIPADLRLLESTELKTMEASLTGESLSVEKNSAVLSGTKSLGDLKNILFMGTQVARGHGRGVVIATGMKTEFGKIAHLVQIQKDEPTPLQIQLNRLSKGFAVGIAIITAGLSLLALLAERDLMEMFLMSISLAVSVIPEGLPTVITLTLALGVQRIAKKNAIIRKLSAAETLGSTNVICTDKTGTLTENKMTIRALYINGSVRTVNGIGYDPSETISTEEKEIDLLLHAAALCNNAELTETEKGWSILGDPTEGALLTLAAKGGLYLQKLEKKWARKMELPFDSDRKLMSTWNDSIQFTKGAPDALLEKCTYVLENGQRLKLTPKLKKTILEHNNQFAKRAYRVLGFALKEVSKKADFTEENLTFLGLTAMMDPPRSDVKEALRKCETAHIQVIMITGDHALTAQAIGEEIGLFKRNDKILTGADLDKMSARELSKIVNKVRIFARVNPGHKVKILAALQAKGKIVAMTGDGVNDAPALKRADIGIAMGISGTDTAKEASDMILADDHFATIVSTVQEGRVIYRNIRKFIRFLLSANFNEVTLVSITFLLGYPLPFLPLQILWVNLLTESFPALALGMDEGDADIMELKPRPAKSNIVKELASYSLVAGLLSSAIPLIFFFYAYSHFPIEKVRTLMFTTIVVFELFLVFSVRHPNKPLYTNWFSNKWLLASLVLSLGLHSLAIYHPFFQRVLQTQALDISDWLLMFGICLPAILILELWKRTQPKTTHV